MKQLEDMGIEVDFCSACTNLDAMPFPYCPDMKDISGSKSNRQKISKSISKADVVICSESLAAIWLIAECFRQRKRCLVGIHSDIFMMGHMMPDVLVKVLFSLATYLTDITFTTSYIFKQKLKLFGMNVNFVMDQDSKCDEFKMEDNPWEIQNLRNKLICKGTDFIALYAGRLAEEKRIELLFPSLPSNVTLVIVGDGAEKKMLEQYKNQHHNVRLVGEMVPQENLRKYYKAADLHISASNFETYGTTVRESLYCGTPVVVQNDGGFTEQVRPFVDGFLVDFSNAEQAKAIITKACTMLDSFSPCPQPNDVVDLCDFISNGTYHNIMPYSHMQNNIFYYSIATLLQYVLVIFYYCVTFSTNFLGTKAE